MATIGYNEGYYSRSKWNDLAFQGRAIITAVSSAQAQGSIIVSAASVISAVSDASVVGTKIFLGSSFVQANSQFISAGQRVRTSTANIEAVASIHAHPTCIYLGNSIYNAIS